MSYKPEPRVYWITGLPGTGKSTLASWLNTYLINKGTPVVWLDGDVMRAKIFEDFSYGQMERRKLAIKYHNLVDVIYSQNISVIVSTVSLFHEVHELNRESFRNYSEIFLDMNKEILASGPRRNQYLSDVQDESPGALEEMPLNPSIRLSAKTTDERLNWFSKLEEYIENI